LICSVIKGVRRNRYFQIKKKGRIIGATDKKFGKYYPCAASL
jgi:hypothetical protein